MNNKIWFLSLPQVPELLVKQLIEQGNNIPDLEKDRLWIDQFHNHELDIAAHNYGRHKNTMTEELDKQINEIYSIFFDTPVKSLIGKIKNVIDTPSQTPPHCDRYRRVAINYLLDTGGDDVYTCMYKEKRKSFDLSTAENCYYKDVTLDYRIKIPCQQWHSYNVQQYHSVENVTGTRLILSLILEDNPSWEEFQQKYEYLQKPIENTILTNI